MAKRRSKARVGAEPTPGTNTVDRFHSGSLSDPYLVAGFSYLKERIHDLVDVDRVCVAAESEATFTDEHRTRIREALCHSWDLAITERCSPTVAEVRTELDALRAAVDAVTVRLADEIDAAPKTQAVGTLIRMGLQGTGLSIDALQTYLRDLAYSVELARTQLPEAKPGVKPDECLLSLNRELHSIYREAGGRGTLRKAFQGLVTEAMLELHRLAEELHHPELQQLFSNTGTASRIRRALERPGHDGKAPRPPVS